MCKNKENNQAKCDVHCIFFPDMTCSSWKFDEKEPYIKRRDDGKQFICAYDGHVIKSWYDECPKNAENAQK